MKLIGLVNSCRLYPVYERNLIFVYYYIVTESLQEHHNNEFPIV